jgi:hypothetical protein
MVQQGVQMTVKSDCSKDRITLPFINGSTFVKKALAINFLKQANT